MKAFDALESPPAHLPRTALIALAVFAVRNPFAGHGLDRFGRQARPPFQFLAPLFLALMPSAAPRPAFGHGPEAGPTLGANPLA